MATQKKKASSRTGGKTSGRSTSAGERNTKKKSGSGNTRGSKNTKEAQGPDIVTIVVVLIAVVLVVVLISKFRKESKEVTNPTGMPQITDITTPDALPQGEATQPPVSTPKATVTPVAEPTKEAPTPTEVPVVPLEEAERIVKRIIQLETYSIELLDDHLMIDGAEYYSFGVNNENGETLEPLLIVEKRDGELLCYDMTGVVAPISRFPLDQTETGSGGDNVLSAEGAQKLLEGYSGERLGLAKEISAYELTVDEWTTMADGVECYGINVFENVDGKQKFRGTFYVALDGSVVYSQDDVTGEFIKR